MQNLIYDIPHWYLGALISGLAVVITLAFYSTFRRFIRVEFTADDRSLAMSVLGVVATINSLLLAFSAVSVWESFGAADAAVVQEANSVGELARDLAVFDSVESRRAREALRRYAQLVVDREWNDMRVGRANEDTWLAADNIFRAVGTLEPDTPKRQALLPEIWSQTNEMVAHRRDRLYASESEVPGTLWAVVLVGSILTVLTTFVLPRSWINIAMMATLAFSLGLVFFFIIAMDRPFTGKESISPAPFSSALVNMQRWDKNSH
jgi:hypothetical protein